MKRRNLLRPTKLSLTFLLCNSKHYLNKIKRMGNCFILNNDLKVTVFSTTKKANKK